MNKHEADRLALSRTLTFGDLRRDIARCRGRGGVSSVNPSLHLEQALDIYEAAIKGEPDDLIFEGWIEGGCYSGRMVRSKESLIARNILRDCR